MDAVKDFAALFVVVNAGFAVDALELARSLGAKGATILNARGEGALHKSIMGITVDTEKEILLILIERKCAERIMEGMCEQEGWRTRFHGVCFMLPVDKTTNINMFAPANEETKA